MKFSEAMKLLEEGKKVRSKFWGDAEYIWLINGKLESEQGYSYALDEDDFDFDWEEYIEPETKKIKKLDADIIYNIFKGTGEDNQGVAVKMMAKKIDEMIDKLNELE